MQRPLLGIAKNSFEVGAVWSNLSLLIKQLKLPKKVFLICTVVALGPEEKKFLPFIPLKCICICTHRQSLLFWTEIKDPINHCNVVQLQCKTSNPSENLALYTVGFLHWVLRFADIWTSYLLTSIFSGLCLKMSQCTAGSYVLGSLNLEKGQL